MPRGGKWANRGRRCDFFAQKKERADPDEINSSPFSFPFLFYSYEKSGGGKIQQIVR